ncbi:MAG: DUF5818 domain-containing protein [Bryobacteraceae bacterium]
MKIGALLLGTLLCVAGLSRAAEFSGWLADAKCARGGKAASAEHAGCAQKCVEGGEAIVLVGDDKKIYKIKNQDKVRSHLGRKVALQAKLEGEDTLEVETGRYLE